MLELIVGLILPFILRSAIYYALCVVFLSVCYLRQKYHERDEIPVIRMITRNNNVNSEMYVLQMVNCILLLPSNYTVLEELIENIP